MTAVVHLTAARGLARVVDRPRPCRRCPPGRAPGPRAPEVGARRQASVQLPGQLVAHAVALRVEVALVEGPHADDEGHGLDHLDAVLHELTALLGVVAEQPDRRDAEVAQHVGRGAVLTGVGGQAERQVGVEGVEAVLLQPVGAQLVDEPDASALVAAQVDDDPAVVADRVEGGVELRPALALERAEGLAGQALGVDPHERPVGGGGPSGPQATIAMWSAPVTGRCRRASGTCRARWGR